MASITLPNHGDHDWDTAMGVAIDAINTDVETRALDSDVMHLSGDETIVGVKTFGDGIVVPDESIPASAVSGLGESLAAAGTVVSVNSKTPDDAGNVALTLDDIPTGTASLPYTADAQTADRDRANHTGTQTSSTITDFASAARIAAKTGIIAGTGISVSVGAGESVTISATGGGGGGAGGYARTTIQYLTATLAASAHETGTVAMGKEYTLSRVEVDGAARIRLYDTAAHRDADVARARGTDPTGDHGVMLDFALDSAGVRTLSPVIVGVNFDGALNCPITVDNIGASAAAITVTLTYKRTE